MDPANLAKEFIPKDLPNLKLSYWAIQSALMCVTALIIPRLRITSVFGPILAVLSIALINATVWDAALFFQVPDHVTAQMGTLLLINGLLFWLIVKVLPGIEVDGLLPAIVAPVVFTVLSLGVDRYHDRVPWGKLGKQALTAVQSVKEYASRGAAQSARGAPTPDTQDD